MICLSFHLFVCVIIVKLTRSLVEFVLVFLDFEYNIRNGIFFFLVVCFGKIYFDICKLDELSPLFHHQKAEEIVKNKVL